MKRKLLEELKKNLISKGRASMRHHEQHTVHASDVYNACARRFAIARRDGAIVQKQFLPHQRVLTFEIGRKIQDIIIDNLPTLNVGHWKCLSCEREMFRNYPVECPKCGGNLFSYKEVELTYKAGHYKFVVHFDGLVKSMTKKNLLYPLEIKSIKAEDFDNLKEPLIQHVYQVTSGLWIARNTSDKLPEPYKIGHGKAYIIYVSKQERKMVFKIYEIKKHPLANNKINEMMKRLKKFSKTGILPPRECSSHYSLMAKNCSLKANCFRGYVEDGKVSE